MFQRRYNSVNNSLHFTVFYKFFGKKTRRDAVAFLGLSESGKTHLMSQLCHKIDVLTVTSIKESKSTFALKNNVNFKLLI